MFIPTLHAEVLDVIFNDWLLHKFRDNLARMDHAAAFDMLLDDLTGLIGQAPAERKSTLIPPSTIQPHAA
jgi:UDP-N-acetylglucosamine--N-acetylmuramyl-(pentapeptide) pyrophosphoryl-undecaprenol N-acetylglucosamine transferase